MILVDTSAWIDYLRATESPADHRLTAAFAEGTRIATTGTVMLEVLAGARDERHAEELTELLGRCRYLRLDEPSDHEAAAAIYRTCRSAGQTVRSLSDCLIAAVAIRTRSKLLHQDADFDTIARFTPLLIETVAA